MPPSQLLLLVGLASVLLLLWRPAGAAEHAVGGEGINGWDTGTNYATWAQAQTFAAGDVLVFEYVKGQHNVWEVTQEAYRSCDATAPGAVLATYDSGFDRVALPEAKSYWFLCQIPNHCIAGMKLAINVSGAGAPAGGDGSSGMAPEAPPSPLSSAAGAAGRSSWAAAWTGLVALGVLHVLVNRAG